MAKSSTGAEYRKDRFRIVLLDVTAGLESGEFRRYGEATCLNGKETGEI